MRVTILVTAELPLAMTAKQFAIYVRDAVQISCGEYHPKEPIYNLERKSVTAIVADAQTVAKGGKLHDDFKNLLETVLLQSNYDGVGSRSSVGGPTKAKDQKKSATLPATRTDTGSKPTQPPKAKGIPHED